MPNSNEFLKYEAYMYKFCHRYKVRDMEDFMQNLRMATIRSLLKFNKNSKISFLTYLHKVYLNELNRHIKTNRLIKIPIGKTEQDTEFYVECNEEYGKNDTSISNDTMLYNKITLKKKLDKHEQHMVKLYLNGYTYREIGKMLSVSHETVRMRMKSITSKLKGEWVEL